MKKLQKSNTNKVFYVKIASATLLLLTLVMVAFTSLQMTNMASVQSGGNTWYVSIGGTLPSYPTDEG